MDIELKSPWVLDLTTKFDKQLSQFGGSHERLLEFYKKFGADGVIYDGKKRWGLDSSTDSSDISYDDLDEGNELWWRKYTANGFRFVLVRVTHKYGDIIFFETVGEKKNKKFYVDCGVDDYEWSEGNASRYSLPKHRFYPIKVVVPSWVDMTAWSAPKKMIVEIKD